MKKPKLLSYKGWWTDAAKETSERYTVPKVMQWEVQIDLGTGEPFTWYGEAASLEEAQQKAWAVINT